MSMRERAEAFCARIADEQASSRAVSLVRIAIPLLLWSRFGSELAFFTRPFTALRIVLSCAFFATTTAMLVGFRARAASLSVGLTMMAIVATRGMGGERAFLHHHVSLLIIVSFLLALTPCGGSFSLDRARALANARAQGLKPPEERGYVYGQWLIRAQVSVIYLFTALDKTNLAFLSGVRMEHYVRFFYLGSSEIEGSMLPVATFIAAIATIALEYALGFLVWVPRTHAVLLPFGLVFHALLYLLLPVHTFSITMAVLYVLVLDPDRVHAKLEALLGR